MASIGTPITELHFDTAGNPFARDLYKDELPLVSL